VVWHAEAFRIRSCNDIGELRVPFSVNCHFLVLMAETPPIAPGQLAPSSSQTVTIAVTKEDAVN
jgi:hypothetical protein